VLAVNPFNSDRKRMSVLLKDTTDNSYIVVCKGADNIMMPLCKLSSNEKDSINHSLLDLANQGLRTLIIAHKPLTADEATKVGALFTCFCC
jgi:P-type E1-E2 ATPase